MQLDDISFDWSGVGPYQSQNPKTTEIHFTTLYPLSYSTIIRVKGTNSCGVSQEFSKTIWVDDCDWNEGDPQPDPPFNGLIDNEVKSSQTMVYPNPVSDEVTVLFNNPNNKKLTLYTVSGQFVLDQFTTESKVVLSLSHLPNGTYFIKIDGENPESKIIIIQH